MLIRCFIILLIFCFTGKTIAGTATSNIAGLINVKDYGAIGDGITSDARAIVNALKILPEDGVLFFPYGKYRVDDSFVISSNVHFSPGAQLSIDRGKIVTITGQIEAGSYQIFTGEGMVPYEKWPRHWISGVVCNQSINVKWFGARGDDKVDDTNAIRSAMFSLIGLDKGITKGGTVYFPRGVYRHKDLDFGSPFYAHLVYWVGDGSGAAHFEGGIRSSATILRYTGVETALKIRKMNLSKMTFLTETGATGILTEAFNTDAKIEDVTVTGFSEYGIDMSSTVSFIAEINKCRLTKNGVGIKLFGNAVTLSNCDISANKVGGILAAGGTVQNILSNTIESNKGYGIRLRGGAGNGGVSAVVTIRGNYIEHNQGKGDIELLADNVNKSITIENNYFNGNKDVLYGIYSERSYDGRFNGNYFDGGHAAGVADFTGYGKTRNIKNTWQHNDISDKRFGNLHGVKINGWEKVTLEKTAQNTWTVNGVYVAAAKNTSANYQNIWILGSTEGQIPLNGVVEGLRLKTIKPFAGVSTAVAKIGTSGSPNYYYDDGYNLLTPVADTNLLHLQAGIKPSFSTVPDFLTVQIIVGKGEDVSKINAGAALDIWVKMSELP
jgi:hypothetical protein